MLTWIEAAACGAVGGLIAEVVVTFGRLNTWQLGSIAIDPKGGFWVADMEASAIRHFQPPT
ncbi:hypothetical protein [Kitasatospora mediocidica]|uniref:hypothetical protein n=1 Tax=Kitasatospora mediocidica TaxID=58352 RepID=UPI00055CA916|nr:hypothetical protein [Kitasatospora mediocidica]